MVVARMTGGSSLCFGRPGPRIFATPQHSAPAPPDLHRAVSNRGMRRLTILVLLPFLAGFTPHEFPTIAAPESPAPAAEEAAASGSFSFTWACGPAPPWTLRGWWKEADAIVRVRVDSQFAYDQLELGIDPFILTELEVTVLEVFKHHERAVSGATMAITHPGGTLMGRNGPETHETNGFPPPPNETEWFLFLRWEKDDQRFWISYLEDGAMQVVDGTLVPQPHASLSTRWRAMMGPEVLAGRLRALAAPLR